MTEKEIAEISDVLELCGYLTNEQCMLVIAFFKGYCGSDVLKHAVTSALLNSSKRLK